MDEIALTVRADVELFTSRIVLQMRVVDFPSKMVNGKPTTMPFFSLESACIPTKLVNIRTAMMK